MPATSVFERDAAAGRWAKRRAGEFRAPAAMAGEGRRPQRTQRLQHRPRRRYTFEPMKICVLPGDGIGVEVIEATLPILQKVQKGFSLEFQTYPAGAQHYKKTGEALPEKTFEAARDADAMLFGAMGWPAIRYPDGTEIAPQLDLRFRLELYAGVRPVRAIPGIPLPLADPRAKEIDLVVVRESTEGLFASRGKGVVEDDREARDTMVITRKGSERVHEFSFRLAAKRRKKNGDLRRQGERVRLDGLLPPHLRRGGGAPSGNPGAPPLHRRHRARSRAPAVGLRRPRHREHVRRHHLRSDRGAHRRHGHGAFGRYRRPARPVSALPRLGARHRGTRKSQSDGDASCPRR